MDFLGIILFIVFMVISASRDRRKGMEKTRPARPEPIRSQPARPEPFRPEPVRPEPVPPKRKKVPALEKREERRTFEPVRSFPDSIFSPKPEIGSSYLEEGMSAFDLPEPIEGPSQGELSPVYAAVDLSRGPGIQELRRAVIWSEILQKPRALRKRIR